MIKTIYLTPVLFIILLSSLAHATELLPLDPYNYTLKMTEKANPPAVDLPSEKIPDDQYRPVKKPWILSLKFSKDLKQVEIFNQEGIQIYGAVLTSAEDDKLIYEMTRKDKPPTVEGAENVIEMVLPEVLTIERIKAGWRGTYTLHGSGVPIISSSRGVMEPVPHKAEQDGAEQPATAPESKSEGEENPKPESKSAPR